MNRHGFNVIALILLSIFIFTQVAFSEQEWLPGYGDKNGTLGKKGQSWRVGFINTLCLEGATSDDFETCLIAVDPTAKNVIQFPDGSGIIITNSGGEDMFNATLVNAILNGITAVEGSIDMGDNPITDIGYFDMNTTNGIPQAEARGHWDDDNGTMHIGLKGGNVDHKVGQEMILRGKNTWGAGITNGQSVYIVSGTGSSPTFGLTNASIAGTSESIGVAIEDIANNQFGYIATTGLLEGIDASGTPVGQTWVAGESLFIANTPGTFTNVMPTNEVRKEHIAHVIRAHATEGVLWVHPEPHPYFSELSGPALTEGSIPFIDAFANTTEDNSNLFWDNSNDELLVSNMADEAEMFISEVTISLDAGGAWANITGMTNGLVSANGMIQNGTDGSITVLNPGRYKSVLGASIEDNDGPSEEYHMSMAVNDVEIGKCEQHRSVSNQASLGAITVPCMFDLSANDVVRPLANSIGGDDLTFEHLHWLFFK